MVNGVAALVQVGFGKPRDYADLIQASVFAERQEWKGNGVNDVRGFGTIGSGYLRKRTLLGFVQRTVFTENCSSWGLPWRNPRWPDICLGASRLLRLGEPS